MRLAAAGSGSTTLEWVAIRSCRSVMARIHLTASRIQRPFLAAATVVVITQVLAQLTATVVVIQIQVLAQTRARFQPRRRRPEQCRLVLRRHSPQVAECHVMLIVVNE